MLLPIPASSCPTDHIGLRLSQLKFQLALFGHVFREAAMLDIYSFERVEGKKILIKNSRIYRNNKSAQLPADEPEKPFR
jgi:hypothetical protein